VTPCGVRKTKAELEARLVVEVAVVDEDALEYVTCGVPAVLACRTFAGHPERFFAIVCRRRPLELTEPKRMSTGALPISWPGRFALSTAVTFGRSAHATSSANPTECMMIMAFDHCGAIAVMSVSVPCQGVRLLRPPLQGIGQNGVAREREKGERASRATCFVRAMPAVPSRKIPDTTT
jgi:hypothetical protein